MRHPGTGRIPMEWTRTTIGRLATAIGVCLGIAACSDGSDLNEGQVRVGLAVSGAAPGARVASGAVFQPAGTTTEALTPDDNFLITLVSAFICDFREFGSVLDLGLRSNASSTRCGDEHRLSNPQGQATRGEIAILAGFQFRAGTTDVNRKPEERLVYFNKDVRESGQLLNFLNLPLYGPAPFRNAAARLRVSVLEIDRDEVEQSVGLLQTLAAAGTAFSSPAYGPVLGVLADLGSSLLRENEDDVELAFDLGFDPVFERSSVHRVLLREGYLLLMRREDRSRQDHFDDIRVCPARGIIVKGTNCDDDSYYADQSWLLLRISRESADVAQKVAANTADEVAEALGASAQERGTIVDTIINIESGRENN